jgi:hypothetical protein
MRYRKPIFTVVGRRLDGRPFMRDYPRRDRALYECQQLECGQVHVDGRIIFQKGEFSESDQRLLYLRSMLRNHKGF